ncbi:UDP-3-O-acyl-N-acetylglucosamine deacetylase [Phormidesmis priestleyi ULC007]|uniref:UDP-3-O-acyl-N-acetylglucosamine deacetylase n=1 Tax=Phormidesmis priestleyi ULC007 TaxID=1920490 RepID=A0A2T1DDE8_9CYAN|nr:UDP-3-O-acyl-N-acetylglucosamine deacetylase [Phormidesmis priestleyi]PSB18461.1 UDP-3-O-acyl-N-acetylglucosamine deacetylase [Phormidesmis priestleyi ULC007]PZO48812.1 MAG: UDP-3-O-acyl-N-acetylglucosamine deacetylase [Phormidesmis priestleyi]
MAEVGFRLGAETSPSLSLQHTLAQEVTRSGIGLHSGTSTQVRIRPAAPGAGRYFVRVDLPDEPIIPAQIEAVSPTMLSTELIKGDARVRTVEHLLAALVSLGIDNARIEIDGAEVPLLDGSAQEWAIAIAQAGTVSQSARVTRSLLEPIWIHQGDAFVAAIPAPELRFSYGIDFELAAIGNQWHSWSPDRDSFLTEIAPARTFGLAHQIDQLRASGLIKGGSLENALVCDAEGWLNPPLRFSNEPVRHKLLDLIGDLSLLGTVPIAHFLAYKASHRLHTQLAQKISLALYSPSNSCQP